MNRYRWFRAGDLNAFFALMFDNVANLVILSAILIGAFRFPREIVLFRMVPGTAVGVLVGDLMYAVMARRLARRSGRDDVTAMPLGLNAPSVFGMSFAVLGPAYLATGDAMLCWKMGMAVTVIVGLVKLGLSFAGNAVRAAVPRAALLGSIGGAGLALIGLLPLLKVFANPVVGFVALGVILVTLLGGRRLYDRHRALRRSGRNRRLLPFLVDWIPAAAVAPILLYIGIEVMAQAFTASPPKHAPAVVLAVLPSLAFVVALEMGPLLPAGVSSLSGETAETVRSLKLLASGFIVTAVLWGASAAALIDRRFRQSAAYLLVGALFCLFGVIHSPTVQGTLFLPWRAGSAIPFHLAAAYTAMGLLALLASFSRQSLDRPSPS